MQTSRRCHGMLKLSETLHARGYNNHVSRVSLRPWNDDWPAVAESIWLLGQHHRATIVVNIYAYSWGGGWGAVRLSRELRNRGISVHYLVLSDAVYRHPARLMWWTSLLGRRYPWSPKIRIPSNVIHVTPFHQTQNRPQGHQIVGDRDFTGAIWESTELKCTHAYMDDAAEFHKAAIDAAEKLRGVR